MRTVAVVTGSRSDYGLLRPILKEIRSRQTLSLRVFVSGMHLSPEFGLTVREVELDGFKIFARVEMLLSSDLPEGLAKSIGVGVLGFAQEFSRTRPDILLLLGDRVEMFAAAIAALPFTIPMAHIHGGETTEGLIDEAVRHSLTKMSHLHFVSNETHRKRVIQMGEEPWRVLESGAPGIDALLASKPLSLRALSRALDFSMEPRPLLVTFHPVTLEYGNTECHIRTLLSVLEQIRRPILFTYPNADTQGRVILRHIEAFVKTNPRAVLRANVGSRVYHSLLRHCAAMVGNSSSGLIEAPSFSLPVVNIGNRQKGRLRAHNVIDVNVDRSSILRGIRTALSPGFREGLKGLRNPYGDGRAAVRIVDALSRVVINSKLMEKTFYDLNGSIS